MLKLLLLFVAFIAATTGESKCPKPYDKIAECNHKNETVAKEWKKLANEDFPWTDEVDKKWMACMKPCYDEEYDEDNGRALTEADKVFFEKEDAMEWWPGVFALSGCAKVCFDGEANDKCSKKCFSDVFNVHSDDNTKPCPEPSKKMMECHKDNKDELEKLDDIMGVKLKDWTDEMDAEWKGCWNKCYDDKYEMKRGRALTEKEKKYWMMSEDGKKFWSLMFAVSNCAEQCFDVTANDECSKQCGEEVFGIVQVKNTKPCPEKYAKIFECNHKNETVVKKWAEMRKNDKDIDWTDAVDKDWNACMEPCYNKEYKTERGRALVPADQKYFDKGDEIMRYWEPMVAMSGCAQQCFDGIANQKCSEDCGEKLFGDGGKYKKKD